MKSSTASLDNLRKLILEADTRFTDKFNLCVSNKHTNMNVYSDRTYNLRRQISHNPEVTLDPHFMSLLQATETYLAPEYSAVAAHQQGMTNDHDGSIRGRALSGLLAGLLKTLLREAVSMGNSPYINDTHSESVVYQQRKKEENEVDGVSENDEVPIFPFRPSKSYAMRKIFIEMIWHWFQAKEKEILDFTLHCRLSEEIKSQNIRVFGPEILKNKREIGKNKEELNINTSTLNDVSDIYSNKSLRTSPPPQQNCGLTDDDILQIKRLESTKTGLSLPLERTASGSNNTLTKHPSAVRGSIVKGWDVSNNCCDDDHDEATATVNKNQRIKEKLSIFKSRNLASAMSLRSLAFSTPSDPLKTPTPPVTVYTKDLQRNHQRRQDESKTIYIDALHGYSGPPTLLHGPPSASYAPKFQNNPSGYTGVMADAQDGKKQRNPVSMYGENMREKGARSGSGASPFGGLTGGISTTAKELTAFSSRNSDVSHLTDQAIVAAEIKTISHLTKKIAEEHSVKEKHDALQILSCNQARIDEESARRIETESFSSQAGRTFAKVLMAGSHLQRAVSSNITSVDYRAMVSMTEPTVALSSSGQHQQVLNKSNNMINVNEYAAARTSQLDEDVAFSLAGRAMSRARSGDINMYKNLLVYDKDKKDYEIPADEIKDRPNSTISCIDTLSSGEKGDVPNRNTGATLSPYDNRIATPVEVIRILQSMKNKNDKYAYQPAITHVGAVQSSNLKVLPSNIGQMRGREERFGLLAPDARNGVYCSDHIKRPIDHHHSSLLEPKLDVIETADCVTTKQVPRLDIPISEQLLRASTGNKGGRRRSHQQTLCSEQHQYIHSSVPSLHQLQQLRFSDRVRTAFAKSGAKGPPVTRYSGAYRLCVEPMDESYDDCLSLLPFPSDGLPSDPSLVMKKKGKRRGKK